jgi:hypothetical protein
MGTTYERWALDRWLRRYLAENPVSSDLEGPQDGMTGINGLNSLTFGRGGAEVTLMLPHAGRAAFAHEVWARHAPQARVELLVAGDEETPVSKLPFESGRFDLVWNFNVMTRAADAPALLAEMARVSRRWVLVFVPSRLNYAFWLHRLHHRVAGEPWDHGRVAWMHPRPWQRMMAGLGLQVVETVWLDCPWWPDIVDFGQLIADFVPPLKGLARRARPENRLRWAAEDLPYYTPEAYPEVHRQMERLAFFENSRFTLLKQRFAHHVGILARKDS